MFRSMLQHGGTNSIITSENAKKSVKIGEKHIAKIRRMCYTVAVIHTLPQLTWRVAVLPEPAFLRNISHFGVKGGVDKHRTPGKTRDGGGYTDSRREP